MYIHKSRLRGADIQADDSRTQGHHLHIHDCVIEAHFLFTVAAQRWVIFFNNCNGALHVAMSPSVELVKTQSNLIIYLCLCLRRVQALKLFNFAFPLQHGCTERSK